MVFRLRGREAGAARLLTAQRRRTNNKHKRNNKQTTNQNSELFNSLASEARFSAAGARRLGADAGALLSTLAPYAWKGPAGHFAELRDAVALLTLGDEAQVATVRQVRSWRGAGGAKGCCGMGLRLSVPAPSRQLLSLIHSHAFLPLVCPSPSMPQTKRHKKQRPSRRRRARPTPPTCCAPSA